MVISGSIKKVALLCCALSALAIPLTAKAGFFDSITNYFNAPTKNALVATTVACAGLLSTTAYYYWKSWKSENELERSGNYYIEYLRCQEQLGTVKLENLWLKKPANFNARRNFDQCSQAYQSATTSKWN